jgi:hypothetical protein
MGAVGSGVLCTLPQHHRGNQQRHVSILNADPYSLKENYVA